MTIDLYTPGTSVSHAELTVVGIVIVLGLTILGSTIVEALAARVAARLGSRRATRPASPTVIHNTQEG